MAPNFCIQMNPIEVNGVRKCAKEKAPSNWWTDPDISDNRASSPAIDTIKVVGGSGGIERAYFGIFGLPSWDEMAIRVNWEIGEEVSDDAKVELEINGGATSTLWQWDSGKGDSGTELLDPVSLAGTNACGAQLIISSSNPDNSAKIELQIVSFTFA